MSYGSVTGAEEVFPNDSIPLANAKEKKSYKVSIFFSCVPRWEMYDDKGGFLLSYDVFDNMRITHKLTFQQGKNPMVKYEPNNIGKDVEELENIFIDAKKAATDKFNNYKKQKIEFGIKNAYLPPSTQEEIFFINHPEFTEFRNVRNLEEVLAKTNNIDFGKIPKPKKVSFFDKTIFKVCKDVTIDRTKITSPSTKDMLERLRIAILSLKSFFDVQSALGYYGEVEFCIGACMPLEGMMFAMAEILGDSSAPKDVKTFSQDFINQALAKYKDTFKWYTHSKGKWTFKVVYKYIFETSVSEATLRDNIRLYLELKNADREIEERWQKGAGFGDSSPRRSAYIRGEPMSQEKIKEKIKQLCEKDEIVRDAENREALFNEKDEIDKQGTLIFEANKKYLETFANNMVPIYELNMAKLKIQSQKHHYDNYFNDAYIQGQELRAAEGEKYYGESVADYEGELMGTWDLDQEIKRRKEEIEKYLKKANETWNNAQKAVVNEEMKGWRTAYTAARIIIGLGSIVWPPLAIVDFLIECVDFGFRRDWESFIVTGVFDCIAFLPVIRTWVGPGLKVFKLDAQSIAKIDQFAKAKNLADVEKAEKAGLTTKEASKTAKDAINKGKEVAGYEDQIKAISNNMKELSRNLDNVKNTQFTESYEKWCLLREQRDTVQELVNALVRTSQYKEYMKLVNGKPNIFSNTIRKNVKSQQLSQSFKEIWQQTGLRTYFGDFGKLYNALIPKTEVYLSVYNTMGGYWKVAHELEKVTIPFKAFWNCPYHGATILLTLGGAVWTLHGAWENAMLLYRGYPEGFWDFEEWIKTKYDIE